MKIIIESGSDRYEEFLTVLGNRIELKGWKGYTGGLDVEGHSTGTYSIFRNYYSMDSKYDIMYHVSTLLPFYEDDLQHVERKRHLGNDVVNIIFNDSSSPFDPASVITNFIRMLLILFTFSFCNCTNINCNCRFLYCCKC